MAVTTGGGRNGWAVLMSLSSRSRMTGQARNIPAMNRGPEGVDINFKLALAAACKVTREAFLVAFSGMAHQATEF
ncbi:MAG: hypothetical protein WBG50_07320 [Desulfomonilaceae bacterium]